ncbi:hypothetical protein T484DRAFT_1947787 [Baffinella frigidus]|nr:hypothetical protein T484DRAFT_1947787 [Cryptophyta sp. CCMP2293]
MDAARRHRVSRLAHVKARRAAPAVWIAAALDCGQLDSWAGVVGSAGVGAGWASPLWAVGCVLWRIFGCVSAAVLGFASGRWFHSAISESVG